MAKNIAFVNRNKLEVAADRLATVNRKYEIFSRIIVESLIPDTR